MDPRPLTTSHKPLRQAVTDAIRESIVSGHYKPGDRLYEDHLAAELEVSRNPVRESLQALAAESFVEIEPRRGARVAAIDRRRARELFEVRGALEGLVASLAAERADEDQVAELNAIADAGSKTAMSGALAELPMLNTQFHELLAEAAQNKLLTDTLGQLSAVIRWIYAERLNDRVESSWAEHRAIASAVLARDSALARSLAEDHVAAARAGYLNT